MRRVLMMVLVAGLVVAGPASAASAAPNTDPVGGMSLRDHMLTVTRAIFGSDRGTMLDPSLGPRERAYAKINVGGASVQKLQQMMEYSTLNPPTNPAMTPEQYQLRAQDFNTPITTDPKTGEKKLKVQATKPGKFKKLANGSIQFLAASTFIPMIGHFGSNALGGWMGQSDVNSQWCTATADPSTINEHITFSMLSLLSGQDCSMFQIAADFVPNTDQAGGLGGTVGGLSFLGTVRFVIPGWGESGRACYSGQKRSDGTYTWPTETASKRGSGVNASEPGDYSCLTVYPSANWNTYGSFNPGYPNMMPTGPLTFTPDDPSKPVENFIPKTGDPERILECVVTMTDGTTVTSTGQPYRETDAQFSPPACPPVPEGKVADNVSVGEVGGEKIYDEPATPGYKEWAQKYPECSQGACLLDLSVKSGTKLGVSCFDVPDPCADWWTDPNRADNYQCTYGVHALDDEECAVYAGLFKPGRVQVGAPYSDPMTGEWDGTASAPRLDGQAMSQGIQNPASTRSCNGLNIKGFDPVGFVMRPVQCALEWAFVPRPLVVEVELTGGEVAWEKKPPAVIAGIVGNFALAPSASGCSKSVTIFSGQFQQSITPIDACAGSPLAPVAAISRVVTSAAMVVLVIVVLRRQVAGMIGYGSGQ